MQNHRNKLLQLKASFSFLNSDFRPRSATSQEMHFIEKQIGLSLPSDYRTFLQHHGGCNVSAYYEVVEEGQTVKETLAMFFGEPPDRTSIAEIYLSVLKDYDLEQALDWYPSLKWICSEPPNQGWPPELLPIATSGGTTLACLSLFGPKQGSVFCWKDLPALGKQNVYLVGDSFDEFMNSLRPIEY